MQNHNLCIGVWVMIVVFFEVWSCKFVQGLDELESPAFTQCGSSIGPTIELLERFFFIFNFNDAALSSYFLSFFFDVFCIFSKYYVHCAL
jgi:hypothetical protein